MLRLTPRASCLNASSNASLSIAPQLQFHLFKDGTLSDLVVCIEGQEFRCHRLLLAALSQYFRTLLAGTFSEAGSSFVELNPSEVPREGFQTLHSYIYGEDVDVQLENGTGKRLLLPLLKACCFLGVESLMDELIDFVRTSLSHTNNALQSLRVLKNASSLGGIEPVCTIAIDICAHAFPSVAGSSELFDLPEQVFCELLTHPRLRESTGYERSTAICSYLSSHNVLSPSAASTAPPYSPSSSISSSVARTLLSSISRIRPGDALLLLRMSLQLSLTQLQEIAETTIASHFSRLQLTDVGDVPFDVVSSLLKRPDLDVEDEWSLYTFVSNYISMRNASSSASASSSSLPAPSSFSSFDFSKPPRSPTVPPLAVDLQRLQRDQSSGLPALEHQLSSSSFLDVSKSSPCSSEYNSSDGESDHDDCSPLKPISRRASPMKPLPFLPEIPSKNSKFPIPHIQIDERDDENGTRGHHQQSKLSREQVNLLFSMIRFDRLNKRQLWEAFKNVDVDRDFLLKAMFSRLDTYEQPEWALPEKELRMVASKRSSDVMLRFLVPDAHVLSSCRLTLSEDRKLVRMGVSAAYLGSTSASSSSSAPMSAIVAGHRGPSSAPSVASSSAPSAPLTASNFATIVFDHAFTHGRHHLKLKIRRCARIHIGVLGSVSFVGDCPKLSQQEAFRYIGDSPNGFAATWLGKIGSNGQYISSTATALKLSHGSVVKIVLDCDRREVIWELISDCPAVSEPPKTPTPPPAAAASVSIPSSSSASGNSPVSSDGSLSKCTVSVVDRTVTLGNCTLGSLADGTAAAFAVTLGQGDEVEILHSS